MLPVLQPSMYYLESNSESNNNINGNGNGNRNEESLDNRFFRKNETTIANGPATLSGIPLINHIQSRIRSYSMIYRRHRYFRRSLIFLWVVAVIIAISANWLAWAGNSIMESLSIATTAPVDICFITAQYASSTEQLDNLVNLRREASSFFSDKNKDHYHFIAFTNRRDWIEKPTSTQKPKKSKKVKNDELADRDNGWTILVQEFPPETFKRFITQSRWPKFQGFRHERIKQTCDVVFYMDGTVLPVGSPWKFQTEARRILNSDVQLSQELHPKAGEDGGGIAGEMKRCRVKNKDLPSNLKKTMEWFHEQPDFTNDCTMYQNTFFGYAVSSPSFRTAADFAWGHFSLEEDSWRDQPLWCYTLHHFGITPLIIPANLFEYQGERRPANKHTYGKEASNNAQKFYENNIQTKSTTASGNNTNAT